MVGPLVRQVRGRGRVLQPDAADHPHVHLAARRRRADAVLALHDPHHPRLHPLDRRAHRDRGRGLLEVGGVEGQAPLHRLRRRGDDPRRRRVPRGALVPQPLRRRRRRPGRRRGRVSSATRALTPADAIGLGLLHGPAELLPISSSGHMTLVPWLLGRPYATELDPELRKAFEVALHAGTALALIVALRDEVGEAARGLDLRRVTLLVGSFVPPAVAGFTLERPIERRLGTPPTIAIGLLAGSAAMALADVRGATGRARDDAGPVDALLLGVGQACALIPGASRNGMTLAVARARGFDREDANVLSRHVALPIILGASALKGTRLARRGLPAGMAARFGLGVVASFVSTLASVRLIRQVERDRSLLPYAAYRTLLAGIVLRTARRRRTL
ncbi:hypothetical protein GKE82_14335 [Conexibacter sp. W3-3-2]|nr:hypothetical protein [Conexibacter sp. W3-3-2]